MERPTSLSASMKESFAYPTMAQRVPVTVTKTISDLHKIVMASQTPTEGYLANKNKQKQTKTKKQKTKKQKNKKTKNKKTKKQKNKKTKQNKTKQNKNKKYIKQKDLQKAIEKLGEIKYELEHNKPIKEIKHGKDAENWNNEVKKLEGKGCFNVSWLFAECYIYRRIIDACWGKDFFSFFFFLFLFSFFFFLFSFFFFLFSFFFFLFSFFFFFFFFFFFLCFFVNSILNVYNRVSFFILKCTIVFSCY